MEFEMAKPGMTIRIEARTSEEGNSYSVSVPA